MGLIRLLLAVAVLNSHFPMVDMPVVDGHEAVLTFFAISGFYMALILDTKYDGKRQFYLSRFLSLYPMYLFALTLAVGLVVSLDIHPMAFLADLPLLFSDPLATFALIWASVFIVGHELLFSFGQSPDGSLHLASASRDAIWANAPMFQAWSLSLEIVFYAMAPWLVRLRTASLALLIAASLALKIAVICSDWGQALFFRRFFPCEFWLFACGILAYRAYASLPKGTRPVDYLLFIALAVAALYADDVPQAAEPFALPGLTLIVMPFVFRGFANFRFDCLAGKLSYPFYLLHLTVIAVFEKAFFDPEGWHILVATAVAAMTLHRLFSSGIEAAKEKMRSVRVQRLDTPVATVPPNQPRPRRGPPPGWPRQAA